MLKALKNCLLILSSIILLSTSSYAVTREEFQHQQEDNIVKFCEDFEVTRQANRNSIFTTLFRIPSHYECGLTAFYALHKVMYIMDTMDRTSKEAADFEKLLYKYYIEEYDTYNYIAIHLEYEKYLEEKKISE